MKKALAVALSILIALLILSFAKDALVKLSVEKAIEIVTGLSLQMQSFKIGIAESIVKIKDLRLFNPAGYPDKIMLQMPEIFVDYELPALLRGRTHLKTLRINMEEFVVVKNKDGALNLDALKLVRARKDGKKPRRKKAAQLQIDVLELKVGRVLYKDYSMGLPETVIEYRINLNERYKDISDPDALASLIVVSSLIKTNIPKLTDFRLADLERTLSLPLATAQKIAEETTVKAEKAIRETAETLRKSAEELKDKLKLPFTAE